MIWWKNFCELAFDFTKVRSRFKNNLRKAWSMAGVKSFVFQVVLSFVWWITSQCQPRLVNRPHLRQMTRMSRFQFTIITNTLPRPHLSRIQNIISFPKNRPRRQTRKLQIVPIPRTMRDSSLRLAPLPLTKPPRRSLAYSRLSYTLLLVQCKPS